MHIMLGPVLGPIGPVCPDVATGASHSHQPLAVEAEPIAAVTVDEADLAGLALINERAPATRDRRHATKGPPDAQQAVAATAVVVQRQIGLDSRPARRHPQRNRILRRTVSRDATTAGYPIDGQPIDPRSWGPRLGRH